MRWIAQQACQALLGQKSNSVFTFSPAQPWAKVKDIAFLATPPLLNCPLNHRAFNQCNYSAWLKLLL